MVFLRRPDWRVIYCYGLLCVFPTRNIVNFLMNFTFLTATYLSKARYSLFVLKVPLNPNHSISPFYRGILLYIVAVFCKGEERSISLQQMAGPAWRTKSIPCNSLWKLCQEPPPLDSVPNRVIFCTLGCRKSHFLGAKIPGFSWLKNWLLHMSYSQKMTLLLSLLTKQQLYHCSCQPFLRNVHSSCLPPYSCLYGLNTFRIAVTFR